ncbi:MAG: 4-hydroxythreonine-4-phosphate dehydrogenase PdxA [Cytophagaceae bacterium]
MGYIKNTAEKPVVGITIGDFNGIGPEIILKTLADPRILKICIPVVYGSFKILSKYKKLLPEVEEISFHQIKNLEGLNPKKVNLVQCWEEDHEINPGKITPEAGRCAVLALNKATEDLTTGRIDAVVTGPINKKNTQGDDFKYPGHTEYFTHKSGANESLMLLVSELMRIGVVTGHVPIGEVNKSLTKEKILSKINILYKSLKNDFGITKPKLALLGLNPHAGEDGLIGNEENDLLTPIVEELKTKGILIFGPFPADAFFGTMTFKKFDGILGMYHDQGLIPFKTLSFETGVNFTAGLNVIRTSPDHGTAYDIAGKNMADETSFREAVFLATDIAKKRKPVEVQP